MGEAKPVWVYVKKVSVISGMISFYLFIFFLNINGILTALIAVPALSSRLFARASLASLLLRLQRVSWRWRACVTCEGLFLEFCFDLEDDKGK